MVARNAYYNTQFCIIYIASSTLFEMIWLYKNKFKNYFPEYYYIYHNSNFNLNHLLLSNVFYSQPSLPNQVEFYRLKYISLNFPFVSPQIFFKFHLQNISFFIFNIVRSNLSSILSFLIYFLVNSILYLTLLPISSILLFIHQKQSSSVPLLPISNLKSTDNFSSKQ